MNHRVAFFRVLVVLVPMAVCAQTVQTALLTQLLQRHEFTQALETATLLHKQVPDDLTIRAYLADAYIELGDYEEAVKTTQALMNLRPGNPLGLTRAGRLRELHGDNAGALELLHRAYEVTSPQEVSDRVSLLTRMARLQLHSGSVAEAETLVNTALGTTPDEPEAIGVLAQVRQAQHRNDEAIALLEKRFALERRAGNLFTLAQALDTAGQKQGAAKAFADFEQKALDESDRAANANHELADYYVDYAHRPTQALEVASRELRRRHDVFTLDAYAWSLAACGDYVQASLEIHKALAFGSKDPVILRHASEIAAHLDGQDWSR